MTRVERFAVIAIAGCLAAASLSGDTYPRQPGVDALHYVFRVALSDASNEIEGEAVVRVRLTADDVARVVLDLATPTGGRGMTVKAVSLGGKPIAFAHKDDRLTLPLPAPAKAGDELSFTVAYRG